MSKGIPRVGSHVWDSAAKEWIKEESTVAAGGVTPVKIRPGYEYMGKQTITTFTYFGFKEYETTSWKIARRDDTDDSAWQYAYGTGAGDWTTAWATPAGEAYADPPDS